MKQIIKELPKDDFVFPSDVDESKYIGYLSGRNNRGFLIKNSYPKGEFYLVCAHGVTICNNWDSPLKLNRLNRPTSFREAIDAILKYHETAVIVGKLFVFDTPQELFKWVSEGD